MRAIIVAIVVAVVAVALAAPLAGCGRQAVRAAEKEFLADQVMVFDDDPHESASDDHIRTNREGAAGGHGAGGGGCGCN
jgi:lipopolysaccharide export LptBFGC system permease protein LptF